MRDMFADRPELDFVVAEDLLAHAMQDATIPDLLTAMLFHKGFTALTTYRLMHWLWHSDRQNLARYLQSICSEVSATGEGREAVGGVGMRGEKGGGSCKIEALCSDSCIIALLMMPLS